jgi:hypothetical protein
MARLRKANEQMQARRYAEIMLRQHPSDLSQSERFR